MENRILFDTKENTKLFFLDGQKYGLFQTQSEFLKALKLSRGNFWKYYNHELTIPESIFSFINKMLPEEKRIIYSKQIEIKPGNWGTSLGGQRTFSKNPAQIEKAREVAIQKSKLKSNKRFDYNQSLTEDLCEFLGALAGDGCACEYKNRFKINFAGDRRYDFDYYQKRINPIAQKLFNISKPGIYVRDNSISINFHSKLLYELVTKRFGIPSGVKFDKVRVPKEILSAEPKMKAAFIRGCMDTDGCVFFDKRPTYKTPYMRLDLCMYNPTILDEIKEMLAEFGIESLRLANNKHLQITSKENVRKYLEIVGLSNRRHIDKVLKIYPDFEEWNPVHL